MSRSPSLGRDRGQVLPLIVVVLALALGLVVVVGRVGAAAADRARAQTAADAAALAGVEGGRPAATRIAAEHGGELVAFDLRDGVVAVEVRLGVASAAARAARATADAAGCDHRRRSECQVLPSASEERRSRRLRVRV